MRSTYKWFIRRATRPVSTADCTNEWRYFLKYNINISIIKHFKQYLLSFIQSAVFTGRVARQTNRLYVLRMIVQLANCALKYALELVPTIKGQLLNKRPDDYAREYGKLFKRARSLSLTSSERFDWSVKSLYLRQSIVARWLSL